MIICGDLKPCCYYSSVKWLLTKSQNIPDLLQPAGKSGWIFYGSSWSASWLKRLLCRASFSTAESKFRQGHCRAESTRLSPGPVSVSPASFSSANASLSQLKEDQEMKAEWSEDREKLNKKTMRKENMLIISGGFNVQCSLKHARISKRIITREGECMQRLIHTGNELQCFIDECIEHSWS